MNLLGFHICQDELNAALLMLQFWVPLIAWLKTLPDLWQHRHERPNCKHPRGHQPHYLIWSKLTGEVVGCCNTEITDDQHELQEIFQSNCPVCYPVDTTFEEEVAALEAVRWPIGKCPKCGNPWYTDRGLCGDCRKLPN